jgi:hypothetical protein
MIQFPPANTPQRPFALECFINGSAGSPPGRHPGNTPAAAGASWSVNENIYETGKIFLAELAFTPYPL